MALNSRPTRTQLRTQVRNYIMDAGTKFWSNNEVNGWIDDWQYEIQAEFGLVKGIALFSCTSGVSTITYTDIASDILVPGAFYFNNQRLTPRSETDISISDQDWQATAERGPGVVVLIDAQKGALWPPVGTQGGYLYTEYPRVLTFATDTSTLELPPWTRYSLNPYAASRAYAKDGALNDPRKHARYKALWEREKVRLRSISTKYLPKFIPSLSPSGRYTADILMMRRRSPDTPMPPVTFHYHTEQVPTGAINGVNDTFTLTNSPSPANSLQLELDTTVLVQGTHYNLSGSTITFVSAYIPITGQTLYARYRYTS